jgi:hypothetical protein
MTRLLGLVATAMLAAAPAWAQSTPQAHDMRLVGYSDLQGRSAYQPVIHERTGGGSPMSVITAAFPATRSR